VYIANSYKYDFSGRKRKPRKVKGEVYEKYKAPAFRELSPTGSEKSISYANQRLAEFKKYPSRSDFTGSKGTGNKQESRKYTGNFVIGIATLHKSNAVPVTNPEYAKEISDMIS